MEKNTYGSCIVSVLTPTPVDFPYSYLVPSGVEVPLPGSLVRVPLRSRLVEGVVWDDAPYQPVDRNKLRLIDHIFDCPPIGESMRRFIDRISSYTLSPRGLFAKALLSVPSALNPEPSIEIMKRGCADLDRSTPARGRVLQHIAEGFEGERLALARRAGVGVSVVDGLLAQGVLKKILLEGPPVTGVPDKDYGKPNLTSSQFSAAEDLINKAIEGKFSVSLLHGVTGSGKTEVYFEAIASALGFGKQVLILLPEIALTHVFLERFEKRFGVKPAQWHSALSPSTRRKIWRNISNGRLQVVVGARSSLFLPFSDLGLIIVDEEHDSGYKQEDYPFYNARDMAVLRGQIAKIPVILASATPSLESQVNAMEGRYEYIRLSSRFADAPMPEISILDMRISPPAKGHFLSAALIGNISERLAKGEQSLLFLNRRGYAPVTLCYGCGQRIECPHCSACLVEHRFRKRLVCHHCGHSILRPEICPSCGVPDRLVPCGSGVERLAEEVALHFPQARITVLSSDSSGSIQRLRLDLESITEGKTDIVIGTQTVAKGHNFPYMTFVGVVDADPGLVGSDPRAAERTFQILNQVIGRAGRTGRSSLALLQTYQPDHPVLKAIVSGDSEAFYDQEIKARQLFSMPPFARLAGVIVSSILRQEAENHARLLRHGAPHSRNIHILGPAEAPLALVRGVHRMRLLVHGSRRSDIQKFIHSMLSSTPAAPKSVRVQVDIDPQSFL